MCSEGSKCQYRLYAIPPICSSPHHGGDVLAVPSIVLVFTDVIEGLEP